METIIILLVIITLELYFIFNQIKENGQIKIIANSEVHSIKINEIVKSINDKISYIEGHVGNIEDNIEKIKNK